MKRELTNTLNSCIAAIHAAAAEDEARRVRIARFNAYFKAAYLAQSDWVICGKIALEALREIKPGDEVSKDMIRFFEERAVHAHP